MFSSESFKSVTMILTFRSTAGRTIEKPGPADEKLLSPSAYVKESVDCNDRPPTSFIVHCCLRGPWLASQPKASPTRTKLHCGTRVWTTCPEMSHKSGMDKFSVDWISLAVHSVLWAIFWSRIFVFRLFSLKVKWAQCDKTQSREL